MMHEEKIAAQLRGELRRVGRGDVVVTPGPNGTMTLAAPDGTWRGAAPDAVKALDRCPSGRGTSPEFWQRFPR